MNVVKYKDFWGCDVSFGPCSKGGISFESLGFLGSQKKSSFFEKVNEGFIGGITVGKRMVVV